MAKKRKLFGFLRDHRHELFDDEFQAELEQMYRETMRRSLYTVRPKDAMGWFGYCGYRHPAS